VFSKKEYPGEFPEYINHPKIVLTYTSGKRQAYLYPVYYDKPIGCTAKTMYQTIHEGDNVNNMIALLDSTLIHFLLKITQYTESPNHKNEFKILNMISKPNIGKIKNDNDVYKYFGLNTKEIAFINQYLSNSVVPHANITRKAQRKPRQQNKTGKHRHTKSK
jgi:hypothetical protein